MKDFIKAYKNWKLSKANKQLLEDICSYRRDWDSAAYEPSIIQAVEENKVEEWWVKAHKILGRSTK